MDLHHIILLELLLALGTLQPEQKVICVSEGSILHHFRILLTIHGLHEALHVYSTAAASSDQSSLLALHDQICGHTFPHSCSFFLLLEILTLPDGEKISDPLEKALLRELLGYFRYFMISLKFADYLIVYMV